MDSKDVQTVLSASILSGQNAVLISPPGWGKSTMVVHAARSSGGGWNFIQLSPATPPEVVEGAIDIIALKEGRFARNLTGSAFDPDADIVILDELFRANDVTFDVLLHATNDVVRGNRRVYWGTSNFVVKNARTEALLDRFALWLHLKPVQISAQSLPWNAEGDMPSVPSIEEAWEVRGASVPDGIAKATDEYIQAVVDAGGFALTPRRLQALRQIVARCTMYEGVRGGGVGALAMSAMRFAWPVFTPEEQAKWAEAVGAASDPVGSAIEAIMQNAFEAFRDVVSSGSGERAAKIARLGEIMANAQEELDARYRSVEPERVAEAMQRLAEMFSKAARGERFEF